MGRAPRITEGGYVYYVVCSGLDHRTIFRSKQCIEGFVDLLRESVERWEPRLIGYALVPQQWHMLVVPRKDGDLSKWVAWLTSVHAMRNKHLTLGMPSNGIYERRYRSFPVQENNHLVESLVWLESLPFRGTPTEVNGEQLQRSSLNFHVGQEECSWLSSSPVALPDHWDAHVASGLTSERQERIEYSLERGAPFGDSNWVERMAKRFRLESTLRPRGRPTKK